jgi:hypothetical protein
VINAPAFILGGRMHRTKLGTCPYFETLEQESPSYFLGSVTCSAVTKTVLLLMMMMMMMISVPIFLLMGAQIEK